MADLTDRRAVYVGGRWAPGHGTPLTLVSPVTEDVFAVCATASRADIDAAVHAARAAVDASPWPHTDPAQRAQYLRQLHAVYERHLPMMHRLVCAQNGSLRSYTAQVTEPLQIIAETASYGQAAHLFGRAQAGPQPYRVRREPVGVVAALTPADMPQQALLAKLAPALLAGCAVIVRPCPQTPLDALYLADLADTVGLPPGVLSVLPTTADTSLLEYLVTHPGVDKVSYTGSAATGAAVARLCAADLRRVTLHCGGRSAAVITADADLPAAVQSLRSLALANSGQLRRAVGRLVVHESVAVEFTERMRAMMRTLRVGDPAHADTDIGPLATGEQRRRVQEHIRLGREQGALILTGMGQPDRPGWYVYPTLFSNVAANAAVARNEICGPVLTVHPFRDDQQALALANGTRFGLAAAVYCADPGRAARLAAGLKAGSVQVNGAPLPPSAPHGGVKHSGLGREGGPEGLAEYQEIKAVAGLDG